MSAAGLPARVGAGEPRDLLPPAIRPLRAAMEAEWLRLGLHRGETLGEAIRRGAERFPDCELVFHSEVRPSTVTLPELVARAERVAAAWHRLGLREGDVVAIQMPNWAETAISYAAAGLLGAVFVPIVQIYGPAEVGFILRQSRARALLVPTRFRRLDYSDGIGPLNLLCMSMARWRNCAPRRPGAGRARSGRRRPRPSSVKVPPRRS